ncbi:MAG: MogA/MoaB family molybdenum cofactor biosynthesis protein [Planctomycetota bacterium]
MPNAPQSPDAPSSHRDKDPSSVRCLVITVSDTRTDRDDRGGSLAVELLEAAGHMVKEKRIVPDEPSLIAAAVNEASQDESMDAVLLTGGTGVSARDQTPEAIAPLLTKELPGYGELLRQLSYEEIGPMALLSRAVGGVAGGTIVLTMPGSPAAVRLAVEKVIAPTLSHLVREATK